MSISPAASPAQHGLAGPAGGALFAPLSPPMLGTRGRASSRSRIRRSSSTDGAASDSEPAAAGATGASAGELEDAYTAGADELSELDRITLDRVQKYHADQALDIIQRVLPMSAVPTAASEAHKSLVTSMELDGSSAGVGSVHAGRSSKPYQSLSRLDVGTQPPIAAPSDTRIPSSAAAASSSLRDDVPVGMDTGDQPQARSKRKFEMQSPTSLAGSDRQSEEVKRERLDPEAAAAKQMGDMHPVEDVTAMRLQGMYPDPRLMTFEVIADQARIDLAMMCRPYVRCRSAHAGLLACPAPGVLAALPSASALTSICRRCGQRDCVC